MEKKKKKRIFYGKVLTRLMVIFFILGGIFQFLYKKSPVRSIPINSITHTIQSKCSQADEQIKEIKENLKKNNIKNISELVWKKNSIGYFVYEGDNLIFWTNNRITPKNTKEKSWQYALLPNMHTLVCSDTIGKYNIVAHIPLKYNFTNENDILENVFLSGISLDKEIKIKVDKEESENAICSKKGDYLFSLKVPKKTIYNESLSQIAFVFFAIAFSLLLFLFSNLPIWFGRTSIRLREFALISFIAISSVLLLLGFDIPSTFFANKIFSPYDYSGSFFVRTFTHLSFFSLFLIAEVLLFSSYVKTRATQKVNFLFYFKIIVLLVIPIVGFFIVRSFFFNIAYNSSIKLNFFQYIPPTLPIIWLHFLFFMWGMGLMLAFISVHRYALGLISIKKTFIIDTILFLILTVSIIFIFKENWLIKFIEILLCYIILYFHLLFREYLYGKRLFALWLFFFIGLYIFNFTEVQETKKIESYKVLTENRYLLDDKRADNLTVDLFQELQQDVEKDKKLYELLKTSNSSQIANVYFKNKYLKGLWKKYRAHIVVTDKKEEVYNEYNHLIETFGVKVGNTNFYKIENKDSDLNYIGQFTLSNSKKHFFFLDFYSKSYYNNSSISNLLIESNSDIETNAKLSTATYFNEKLQSTNGKYKYPDSSHWIKSNDKSFFHIKDGDYIHYIYAPNQSEYFVISEKEKKSIFLFLFYYIYVLSMFLVLTLIIVWLYKRIQAPKTTQLKFVTRYSYSFLLIMTLGFALILVFTTFYMRGKYEEQKIKKIKQTEAYIKNYLEEKYYWVKDLGNYEQEMLNEDLDFLSYVYQTDIHIYNKSGELISSSQPMLFQENIMSDRISPIPMTFQNNTLDIIEKIGNLKYRTAYSRFYNKDFKELGYISIPFFFSENRLEKDSKEFIVIIFQTHLLMLAFLILFILRLTRNLSEPLLLLQKNIKEIKLGKKNKRINYKPNDEIGLLVEEYNKTVMELEKSAKMLMQTERESAWRTMAQQIAHEINNPLTPIRLTIQKLQLVKKTKPEQFDAMFTKDAGIIIEQVDNLKRIVKSFSDFSKQQDVEFEEINIVEKLESITTLFRKNEEEVKIIYKAPKEEIFILADIDQITQVFNNLIKNAIQAIPRSRKGYVNIYMKKSENKLNIFVEDNGKGISKRNQKKLFQPKFTTKTSGMGLGLSIVKNIIESMGGAISFESESYKGTTFKVTIPLSL